MSKQPFTTSDLLHVIDSHKAEISKVNESIMSRQFHAVGAMYFDHQCLKDTRLGLLITLSNAERMEYLKAHLNQYNLRPNRHFLFAFPEFPYREEELEKWYKEESRAENIFNVSPDTDLTRNLITVLNTVRDSNVRAGYKGVIALHINMWPLKISPLMERYREVLQYVLDPSKSVYRVHIFSIDPTELQAEFWSRMGWCFIDDIARLTRTETALAKALFEEFSSMHTTIYAALQCDDDVLEVWKEEGTDFNDPEQIAQRFELSAALFSLCSQFTFMAFRIPIPGEVERPKPDITTAT